MLARESVKRSIPHDYEAQALDSMRQRGAWLIGRFDASRAAQG